MGICCCSGNEKDEYEDVSIDDIPAFGAALGSIYGPTLSISNRVPSYSFTYTTHNDYLPTWRFQGTRGDQFNGTLASNVCVYGPTFESIPNLTPRQLKKYGLQDLKMNTLDSPTNNFHRQHNHRPSSPPHYEHINERSSEAYTSPSLSPQVCNLRSSRRANRPNRQHSSSRSPSKNKKNSTYRSHSADSHTSPMFNHYEFHQYSNSKQRSVSADHYYTNTNIHPTNHLSISTSLQSNGPPPSFVTINVTSISPQPPTIQINQNVHKSTQKTTQYNCIPPKESSLPPRLPVDNLEIPKPPPEPVKPLVPIKVNSCSPHCLSSSSSPVRSQTKAVVRPTHPIQIEKQLPIPKDPSNDNPSPERDGPPPPPPPTINIPQETQIEPQTSRTPSPRVINRPSQIEIPKLKLSSAQPKSPLSSPKRRPMSPTSPKRNFQSPRSRQSSNNSSHSAKSNPASSSRSPRSRQISTNSQSPRSRQVSTNSQQGSPRSRSVSTNSQSPRRTPNRQRQTDNTIVSPRQKKNRNKVTILSPSGKSETGEPSIEKSPIKNRQTRFNLKAPAPLLNPSEVGNQPGDTNTNNNTEVNPAVTFTYIGSPKALVSRASFSKKTESPDLTTKLLSLSGNNLSFDLRDLGATYISTDGENDDDASKSDES